MKNVKKKIFAIVTICTFAVLMMLNVSTTITDSNFSVTGLTTLVYGMTGECDGVTCEFDRIEGFRCFYTGSTTYTCDDSSGSECSDVACD